MRRSAAKRVIAVFATVVAVSAGLTAALAVGAVPALAVNKVTVTNPGAQTTDPLSAAVSLPVKATDSAKSSTLSYSAKGLPPGLSIGATSGVISGSITTAGTYTVKVTVVDTTKASGGTSFTWTAGNTISVGNPGTQTTGAGNPVSVAVPAADDDKDTTLTWSAQGLPNGLGINAATGIITGTPTVNGSYTVTVTVTDATKSTASVTFAWNVGTQVTVSAPGRERSTVGVAISPVLVSATDTAKGETFTFSAADLPPGLVINPTTGTITGMPTGKAALFTTTVIATDSTGATGFAPIGWTIANLVTVHAPGSEASWLGIPVSVKITATDSDPAQLLTYTATGLPQGLSINPGTGVISGRPTKVQGVSVTITATDAAGSFDTATLTWAAREAITIPPLGRVGVAAGVALTQFISFADAAPGDHVTLSVHGLPNGMTFTASPPRIFGWTAKPGSYRVTVSAKGSLGDSRSMTFTLAVKAASGSGPAGKLRLDLGGKCLTDVQNEGVVKTCASGSAQQWTVATDGTVRAKGACLDVAGSGTYRGQGVKLFHCSSGSPRETWVTGTAGQLVNPASGLCLGDAKGKTSGSKPTLVTCKVASAEVWAGPAVQLRSARAGVCADDLHGGTGNGNAVDLFTCNGSGSQSWTVKSDDTFRVNGKCLADRGTLGQAGAKLVLEGCAKTNKGQKVKVVRQGTLGSWLTIGGACVAIPSMTAPSGAQLITVTCGKTDPRDLWRIW